QSKKWSATAVYNTGGFYDGRRNSAFLSARFAPIPHTTLTASYEYNELKDIGLENQNLTTNLVTVGSRFALNPRLQLSVFYQYNSFDEQARWNLRASWEYLPLSFVYLVFNDTQINDLDTPFQEQQFISKVTLIRQF
ncbi:MAG: hypothetical protein AAFN65_15390, partial [Bacteroidota bacterium]